jgi:tripartite-type tricarboxylate transporter receptor subunit TctC
MTHNTAQKLFALVLLALTSSALWMTQGWRYKVYFLPRTVAVVVIVLLLIHLALLFVKGAGDGAEAESSSDLEGHKRLLATVGWLLGFVALIAALGFPIGGTLATLLYVRFTAREKWRVVLPTALVVAAFFGITANPKLLAVPYPKGWIVSKLFQPVVGDSFQGETVKVIVGFGADGGVDRDARTMAHYLQKYIPGHPTVIVENMPGADSIVATNYMYSLAPRDGTVLATINSGLVIQEALRADGVNFKSAEFTWLGSLTKTRLVCLVAKTTGVRSLTDLMKPRAKPVVAGALGPVSQRTYVPNFLKLAGAQVRVASGYPSVGQINLALEQGEVDMICGTWHGFRSTGASLLESGKFNVIVQGGDTRDPELPDTELLKDVLAKRPDLWAVWLSLTRPESIGRPFILPPGVPANRVRIVREAFAKAVSDPEFVASLSKLGDGFSPSTSSEVETAIHEIRVLPPEQRTALKSLLTAN